MTTATDVKRIARLLLARNPDLALVGRLVALKPVHHFVRGIYFDRTGQAKQCQPRWMVMHLLAKSDDIVFDAGSRMARGKPGIPGLWWLDDPELPDDLVRVAERDVLPKLRRLRTLQDYLDIALPKDPVKLKFCWGLRFIFALAMDDLDAARAFLKCDIAGANANDLNAFRPGLGDRLLNEGAQVSRDDRLALAEYLHACEAYTVGKLKIDHLWERMPFPIERDLG